MLISINEEGCHDTATVMYKMLFKGLFVPNTMAPTGSVQATRYWKPAGVNLASYRAEVYNRSGILLWSSTQLDENGSPAEAWDGTYKDKPVQQGVYYWCIQAIFRDGTIWQNKDIGERKGLSQEVSGTVTVLR
jgi:hypothetical protein